MGATKLTKEEREHLDSLNDDDLESIVVENEIKRRETRDDLKAYNKAHRDLMKVWEAETDGAVQILRDRRKEQEARAAA